ncbi:YtcA family lipoprotein [Camelimonas fluminis]|nr:YtcA family lipoprotein [Camelimonas fluminis]
MPVVQDHRQGMSMGGLARPARSPRLMRQPPASRRHLAAVTVPTALAGLMTLAGLLAGCAPVSSSLGAPAIPLFDAYFPAWLLCAFVGVIGAVLVRVAFIRIGLDDMFPVRLPVYVAVAVIIGLLVSFFGFGR